VVYEKAVRLKDLGIRVGNFGKPIDSSQFNKIIEKAGNVNQYPRVSKDQEKISKICWNTEEWRFPSGSRGKSSSSESFESQYGYGHEEWLFDRSRIVDGVHYAFLQTLNLKSDIHVGNSYCIHLVTITDKIKYYVGYIKNVKCISKNESKTVYHYYRKNGWFNEMVSELEKAGISSNQFKKRVQRNLLILCSNLKT
jgi:hypothetical protein